jgi:hypothetical protein
LIELQIGRLPAALGDAGSSPSIPTSDSKELKCSAGGPSHLFRVQETRLREFVATCCLCEFEVVVRYNQPVLELSLLQNIVSGPYSNDKRTRTAKCIETIQFYIKDGLEATGENKKRRINLSNRSFLERIASTDLG